MDNFIIYATDTTCMNANSYLGSLCITRVDCTPTCTDFYLSECNQQWNCNLGQCDKPYFNPYIPGDLIQFQTKFVDDYNTDPSNPVNGWGTFITAEVCDLDGNVLQTHLNASRAIVGWDGSSSYQIIEFDTTGLTGCFSVNFETFSAPAVSSDTICSEHFKQVECNEPTVVIESTFSCSDCCGQYYGDPIAFVGDNFNYTNKWRYWGEVIDTGLTTEKTVTGSKRTRTETDDLFRLVNNYCIVPSYIKNMLYKLHLGAQRFTIDGIEYYMDTATISKLEDSKMFAINQQIFRECDIEHGCEC